MRQSDNIRDIYEDRLGIETLRVRDLVEIANSYDRLCGLPERERMPQPLAKPETDK